MAEFVNFYSSIQYINQEYETRIKPNTAGTSACMPGFMFWTPEWPSSRSLCTKGTNTCTGGVGEGSNYFDILVPMSALRQN